ncbi:MAG: 2-phosphosulfolactate phosphatase [Rhodocyclaceae bacterium]|jgi:2-phosphosulfolactate phosphatase|nr:putative 2-phosphosulfolactate phosphatase [Rhodocyclaceae bacterium]MBZ0142309.1 2-phosphosulfolactate phosphatase [Rhodocyclaceae bacterium]MCC6880263.1 2-phosphosulfolactate phosphatase [Rhodocyclaceae bacterium]MCL4681855.1 2-phosphosulfolactate phosphatase [Rhodocyclaceae bacterium]
MKIHVLLKKEELDAQRLPGKTVVVLDILFATSSIVAALAHGAAEVIPTLDGAAAQAEAARHPAGSCVLSGELNAETLPGFVHPTPLHLLAENLAGRTLVYSTTNGTVAVAKSREADHVYAAALLNGEAVVKHIAQRHADETVLIVCSGSADNFNLEDFYGAGYLVSLFAQQGQEHEFSDAALAAQLLYEHGEAGECLRRARVGRMMLERRLEQEVDFAAQKSLYAVVPKLDGNSLRAA